MSTENIEYRAHHDQTEHHHHHHHHHHEHGKVDESLKRVYIISIALNLGFVAIEALMGVIYNSMGLLSDAGHNLSDVFSLALALVAFGLMKTKANHGFTYGYRKSSVIISLINAVILLVAVGAIMVESISKFMNPLPVNGEAVSWTAGIGILINGITAFMLMKKQNNDINTKGAYLHMLADTLVSVGVVLSGFVISFTGWSFIDPIVSLIIAGIILIGTWDIFKESIRMSIDAVPEGVDANEIQACIESIAGEGKVHHLHIWPISTTETALTAHVVVDDIAVAEQTVHSIKRELSLKGIAHSTIEVETAANCCAEGNCGFPTHK